VSGIADNRESDDVFPTGAMPFEVRWFDLTLWGGVLTLAGYAIGTVYERDPKTAREIEDGHDGMLVILENFLANQKHNETHACRISMCATKIAEAVGLAAGGIEDIRTRRGCST
jgi:hypothetical protein